MAAAINVKILGDATSLTRAFTKAERSAGGFNKKMTKSGGVTRKGQGAMRGLGSSVRLASASFLGGAGIVAGITSTLKKTADFEQSMNTFQAVSGATAGQMKSVGKQAQKLGSDVALPGTSAKDAAEAMLELSKAGLSVPQVQKAVRGTLLLSAAAGVDNARAAEIASNTLNAFNINAKKTPKVVDILAGAANASSIEIEDAALSFQQAGAVFSSFQSPALGAEGALEQLGIATGVLGNAGIKGSDAGTSLKQALLSLGAPTDKAGTLMDVLLAKTQGAAVSQDDLSTVMDGSKGARDKLVKGLKKANPELFESGNIAYDANGKMRPLMETMALLGKATKDMTAQQKNAIVKDIFGADASRAALILLRAQGTKAYADVAKAVGKSGNAAKIAAAKQKGLKGAMDALASAVESVQIAVGTTLAPIITKYLQAAAKWLGNTKNQKTILTTLNTVLGTVAATLRIVRTLFNGLARAVGGSKNAIKLLIGVFIAFKALKMAGAVAGVARQFGLLGTRAGTAGTKMRGARGGAAALRGGLVGKLGVVGAVAAAAFVLSKFIRKIPGWDKKMRGFGSAVGDIAEKLGAIKDPGEQFKGKKILTGAESRKIRQQAARLEAGGLTPQQATNKIIRGRPNLARRDVEVLAGVHGQRPVVNIHIDGRRDDAEAVARKVSEAQRKHGKRNTTQRRGR